MATKRKYLYTFRVPKDETEPLKYWQANVELKPHPDGSRRRKQIRSKDRDKAENLYKQAVKDREASGGDLPTRALTVRQWVDEWFTTIATLDIKPKTANTYRGLIAREILPAIGDTRLERLTTKDVRDMAAGIIAKGLSPTTAAQVHRILSIALKAAVADGHVPRNVAAIMKTPRSSRPQLTALTAEQGMKVLQAAGKAEWPSLWWAVLLTGARQGELLGLELDRLSNVLDLSWQLQRLPWEHGCKPECGRKRGSDCPSRKITAPADWQSRHLTGGLWLTAPKSRAGTRIVPVANVLGIAIRSELAKTADQPNPYGLVWHMKNGNPIDPRVQSEAWHDLLARAGVPDVRLHDGRHTVVDLLYEAGVAEDEITNIIGHSVRSTTRGYKSNVNLTRRTNAMQQLATMLTPLDSGTRSEDAASPGALER